MKVQLVTNDSSRILREAEVPEFPDNPQVIIWEHRAFLVNPPAFGPSEIQYVEQSTVEL